MELYSFVTLLDLSESRRALTIGKRELECSCHPTCLISDGAQLVGGFHLTSWHVNQALTKHFHLGPDSLLKGFYFVLSFLSAVDIRSMSEEVAFRVVFDLGKAKQALIYLILNLFNLVLNVSETVSIELFELTKHLYILFQRNLTRY